MINDLYVSMTHTKTGVAVMLSDENDSIDMETIRKIDEPLLRHTLCENEQKFLQESRDQDEGFTICWTFKEALIKQLFEEKPCRIVRSIRHPYLKKEYAYATRIRS